jgi:YD repeat-containing protein
MKTVSIPEMPIWLNHHKSCNASSQSSCAGGTTATGTITPDTTAPSTPTDLIGTAVAGGRIGLSWTASTDDVAVAGYNLYRDGVKINTAPIGSTGYSDTGLAPGVNHTWTVSALDAAGNESSQSSSWAGTAGDGATIFGYSYDSENRLTRATSGSQTLGSYAYDGLGNGVSKIARA